MKKIVFLLIMPFCSHAQNNIIKTNLMGLAIKNYNITYERSLARVLSFSIGVRHMPKSSVPLKSQIEKLVDNQDFKINDFQMGNTTFTGEARFYLGIRKMSGFYIAPYLRYSSFDFTMPIKNPNEQNSPSILFNGKINATSAGLLMGVQHCFLKKLVLDIWILGGHYGKSNGSLIATEIPNMNSTEQNTLQSKLDEFNEIGPFKTSSKVTSSSAAEITTTGPWLGLRSFALSVGYRF